MNKQYWIKQFKMLEDWGNNSCVEKLRYGIIRFKYANMRKRKQMFTTVSASQHFLSFYSITQSLIVDISNYEQSLSEYV